MSDIASVLINGYVYHNHLPGQPNGRLAHVYDWGYCPVCKRIGWERRPH